MTVHFTDRERYVASLRAKGMTFTEIAAVLPRGDGSGVGVTRERARQIFNIHERKSLIQKRKGDWALSRLMRIGAP